MSLAALVLRNLLYHLRGNGAVFLGVALGSAVLTGALLVGDSLRGSLQALTLQRLGWVELSLVAPRFFREELAQRLVDNEALTKAEGVILLKGSVAGPAEGGARTQARDVTVLGVRTGDLPLGPLSKGPNESAWISSALARALDV